MALEKLITIRKQNWLTIPASAISFLLALGVGSFAQTAVRPQFETAEQTSNKINPVSSPSTGEVRWMNETNIGKSSDDLGEQWIYQPQEKPKAFTAAVDVSGYHTSNVALSAANELEDNYLVGQLSVGWQQPISYGLIFDVNLSQAFFRYDDFEVLNFDSLNVSAGITGPVSSLKGTSWFGRYNFNRLTAENWGTELYTSHSLLLGLQKTLELTRADSLFVGTSAQINFANPDSLERREYAIYGGYALALTRSIMCDVVYRAALYDYNEASRTDVNQSFSAGLRWKPIQAFAVNCSAAGTLNRSDKSSFDYNLLNTGLTLSVLYQF